MRLIYSSATYSLTTLFLVFLLIGQADANQPVESFMWKASATMTTALIVITNPIKADRVSMEIGGGEHVYVTRVGAEWDWKDDLMEVFDWKLSTHWQLDFSKWQSERDSSQDGANVTLGLTPTFRFTGHKGYVQPYFDVGVGVYVFSVSHLDDHEFGSNFQFSDRLGVGVNMGARNQWGLGYKFQHYSNGSVRVPNPGINFHLLTLSYKY